MCSGCSDEAEYIVDDFGRQVATRNRRGTWTTLTFVGDSRKIASRTDNSDPETLVASLIQRRFTNGETWGSNALMTTYADYDIHRNPGTMTDAASLVHLRTYNETGALLTDTTVLTSGNLTTTYHYDQGRLQWVLGPSGVYSVYSYVAADLDGQGQIVSIIQNSNGAAEPAGVDHGASASSCRDLI